MVERGDVWLVSFDPTVGREIKKTRPAVIVTPDELTGALSTVIVAPMTTGATPAPFRAELTFQRKHGRVLLDQLRAIDKERLIRRLGRLEGRTIARALEVLRQMFAE